ncbi:MAG: DUF58 domain-containing protein [Desulfurococcales archaeon]|nr:DUF58 domain-containing protein [Desulfurococcales archaeon]
MDDYCRPARIGFRAARAASSIYYHGSSPSIFKGRGLEYVDFREYSPGDEPGRIDWRLTARSPGESGYRLMVREYEEEHIRRVHLAVGLYDSMFYGVKPRVLAYIVTLISRVAERLGDEVYLTILAGEEAKVRLLRPPLATYTVLRELCQGPRGGDPDRLLAGLRISGRPPLILVVDYNLSPSILEGVFARARSAGVPVLTVIVYDRREVEPPPVDGVAAVESPVGMVYGRVGEFYGQVRRHVARVEAVARMGLLAKAQGTGPGLARRILGLYLRLRGRTGV